MHPCLIELMECPACHGELDWSITGRRDDRVYAGEARCKVCGTSYPFREGIGLFLTPDLPREDLWQQVDGQLTRHLRERPEVERQLMQVPPRSLHPADLFFRALALEERGDYAEARAVEDLAQVGLYTPEYLSCWKRQCDYLVEQLSAADGPIVDLASGRCYLVERLARELNRPIVASDFSPRVLQRDRRWLEARGLYEHVSLLAFDARRTPFKTGAVQSLTTNLGLPNIRAAGDLLLELHRIVSGTFWAISHFYPEDDAANARKIHELKLERFLYRRPALESFAQAGWHVDVLNSRLAKAQPTPLGVVLEDAVVDALPMVETTLEWCVLVVTPQVEHSE